MNFSISNEQIQIREELIAFTKANLNDISKVNHFSSEMWNKIAEFGLFGLVVSEEAGGLGESYLTAALLCEAIGYSCINNGFIFAVANHMWVGINLIYLYGSDNLRERYLKKMISGVCIGAMALTEADAGSDANSLLTEAVKIENGYLLNGNKLFVSNGPIADIFIVYGYVRSETGTKDLTAFVVEKNFSGFEAGKDVEKMGLKSCPMGEIVLKDCFIPNCNVLGEVGAGEVIMKNALEWERCFEFASHVGTMQRVLEQVLTYVEQREQFGKKISTYQAISHKIADMKVRIEMSKLMLYKIAWLKDNYKIAYLETAIFKLYVSESYITTCRDAMQIYGAYGYVEEYGVEREMRDALACSIYSGTSEIQRNTIFNFAKMDVL